MFDTVKRPRSRSRAVVRTLVGILALVGIWRAVASATRVAALQSEYQRLALAIGHMPIKDPKKVNIVAIPSAEKHVWRFRIYLPPNYQFTEVRNNGRISASTPRNRFASGSTSSGSPEPDPVEFLMSIAILKDRDDWAVHTTGKSSRGVTGINSDFVKALDIPGSFIVECVGQEGPAEFATDEPICLLRIRGTKPVQDENTADPLYEGLYYYIVPSQIFKNFEAAKEADPART